MEPSLTLKPSFGPYNGSHAWDVVVNNADPIPDFDTYDGKNFSSYNAPSVNKEGFVVFRARSTG